MIYVNLPPEASKKRSVKKRKPKTVLAYLCEFYDTCLSMDAYFDRKEMPCRGCQERRNISLFDLDDDLVNYWLLLVAVMLPEIWRRSVFWRIRQMSFDEYSEYDLAL